MAAALKSESISPSVVPGCALINLSICFCALPCFAAYLPASKKSTMDKLIDQAEDIYFYGIEGTKSVKVKGTLKKLSGTELKYYNETVEELEEIIPGITDAAVLFYVDSESVNRVPTIFLWIIYAVCIFGLIQIVLSVIRYTTGTASCLCIIPVLCRIVGDIQETCKIFFVLFFNLRLVADYHVRLCLEINVSSG